MNLREAMNKALAEGSPVPVAMVWKGRNSNQKRDIELTAELWDEMPDGEYLLYLLPKVLQAMPAILSPERIDWIANAHCPSGVAYPHNVKCAINDALRETSAHTAAPAEVSELPQQEVALTLDQKFAIMGKVAEAVVDFGHGKITADQAYAAILAATPSPAVDESRPAATLAELHSKVNSLHPPERETGEYQIGYCDARNTIAEIVRCHSISLPSELLKPEKKG